MRNCQVSRFIIILLMTFQFYEIFNDTFVHLFDKEPDISPHIDNLCDRAKSVLGSCCEQQLTLRQESSKYEKSVSVLENGSTCECSTELKIQFHAIISFNSYLVITQRVLSDHRNGNGSHRNIIWFEYNASVLFCNTHYYFLDTESRWLLEHKRFNF